MAKLGKSNSNSCWKVQVYKCNNKLHGNLQRVPFVPSQPWWWQDKQEDQVEDETTQRQWYYEWWKSARLDQSNKRVYGDCWLLDNRHSTGRLSVCSKSKRSSLPHSPRSLNFNFKSISLYGRVLGWKHFFRKMNEPRDSYRGGEVSEVTTLARWPGDGWPEVAWMDVELLNNFFELKHGHLRGPIWMLWLPNSCPPSSLSIGDLARILFTLI